MNTVNQDWCYHLDSLISQSNVGNGYKFPRKRNLLTTPTAPAYWFFSSYKIWFCRIKHLYAKQYNIITTNWVCHVVRNKYEKNKFIFYKITEMVYLSTSIQIVWSNFILNPHLKSTAIVSKITINKIVLIKIYYVSEGQIGLRSVMKRLS